MATDVHSVFIETLEAPLPVGTAVNSVVLETLEAPLPVGTVVNSVVIETLEAPLPVGTVVNSVVIETLEAPPGPTNAVAVIAGNIVGTAGTPASFDGSGSTATALVWNWSAVPGGSALVDTPLAFPDSGGASPFDMTNNAVLYHLNGNANDTSGNGLNGTEVGAPTYAAGQIGQAISLDGTTGQYASVANDPAITITGSMSISAWVNMELTGDGFQRIAAKATGGSGAGGYALYVNTNGQPRVAFGGTQTTGAATGLITASTWHHVVGTWDGTSARVYVDGAVVDTQAAGSGPGSSTADLHIGADPSFPGLRDFKGLLDEVAIWSRALSDAEVKAAYEIGSGAVDGGDLGTFTGDVAGTYTIQLAAYQDSFGGFTSDTTTADAVISAAPTPGAGREYFSGTALFQLDLIGVFLPSLTAYDPAEDE